MIDTENLRTASLYINNQLLSRGLLRDGQKIDFVQAAKDNGEASATMGKIMSVVNDLILRRDVCFASIYLRRGLMLTLEQRDAQQRESLSSTMRALRSDNLKSVNDVAKLSDKNTEAQRKLDIAESAEASLKTQLKSADAAVRGLKEELARTKALVSQARASCATDVRRRDRQIDTLKKQLGEAGRARGSRGSAITTITVAAGVGEDKTCSMYDASTSAEDYSLRSETNAFLANLAQNLSEENEKILRVVKKAMEQLQHMSGWSGDGKGDFEVVKQASWEDLSSDLEGILNHMRTILTNPSFVPIEEVEVREEEINRLKDGWVKMESRWKEAVHLIDGWRKRMAASGRPICEEELRMGLRLSPVRVLDVEETRGARGFGLSAVAEMPDEDAEVPPSSPCPSGEDVVALVPTEDQVDPEDQRLGNQSDSSDSESEDIPPDEYDVEEPNVEILQQSTFASQQRHDSSLNSSPLPEPPQISPLRNSSSAGNRGSDRNAKPGAKVGEFTTIAEEDTVDLAAEDKPPQPPPHRLRSGAQPVRPSFKAEKTEKPAQRPRSPTRTSLDEALLGKTLGETSRSDEEIVTLQSQGDENAGGSTEHNPLAMAHQTPRRGPSRLPLPRQAEAAAQQSPLTMATIAAKLAASEREADAARVRAKLKAARSARGAKRPSAAPAPVEQDPQPEPVAATTEQGDGAEDVDPVKRDLLPQAEVKVEKRKRDRRTSKAASRRRSTLSPWELESLISGAVQ